MVAGPFARILAQIVVPVVAILARALPSAYAQAVQNARKAGVDASSASAEVLGKRITRAEALQILNLTEQKATVEAIQKVSKSTLRANMRHTRANIISNKKEFTHTLSSSRNMICT